MLPRPRLLVKKRGTRRTSTPWASQVAEGLMLGALIALGAFGSYWLIDHARSAQDVGVWPWFAMVIPTALIVYGALGLVSLLWRTSASTERRAAVVQKAADWELPGAEARPSRSALPALPGGLGIITDSPGVRLAYRLPIDAAAGWMSFAMAAVCIALLVAMFVVQVVQRHQEGRPIWLLTWLMVPFVMAGVWTLVALARQVLLNIAIGTTRLEVSHHPFFPGATFQGFVSQTGRLHVRWFQVQLLCEEQAIHQQGTDTRRATSRVYRATLFSQRKFEITPQQAFEAAFDIPVPASAMHSFVSPHNAVIWVLVVRGRMARWGEFERRFPIHIYPHNVMARPVDPMQYVVPALPR